MAGQRLQLHPRSSPFVGSDDSKAYLHLLSIDLELALFPYACRHPHAAAAICDTKPTAWQWANHQIRDCMTGPRGRMWEYLGKAARPSPKPSDA